MDGTDEADTCRRSTAGRECAFGGRDVASDALTATTGRKASCPVEDRSQETAVHFSTALHT
jgi:hypothetical protein